MSCPPLNPCPSVPPCDESPSIKAGDGLIQIGDKFYVLAKDDSIVVEPSGIRAAVPTRLNKAMTLVLDADTDNFNTGLTIASTPGGDGYVQVFINGVLVEVGDGDVTKDCYFRQPSAPFNVRTIACIEAGDQFFWNSVRAGYILKKLLDPRPDVVDFCYNVVNPDTGVPCP